MDEILNAVDALLAEGVGNIGVVVKSNSGSVDLTVASLVDELADGIASGVAVGDVGLDHSDHVDSSLVELDEDTVMELSKSKELHDLLLLGWELVNTSGSDNEGDLGLGVNVEVAGLLGSALGINNGLVGVLVLLGVLGGVGSGDLSGLSAGLLLGGTVVGKGLEELSVSLLLLEDVLGDGLCQIGRASCRERV